MFWTSDKHQEFINSKICSVHKKKQMDEFGFFSDHLCPSRDGEITTEKEKPETSKNDTLYLSPLLNYNNRPLTHDLHLTPFIEDLPI